MLKKIRSWWSSNSAAQQSERTSVFETFLHLPVWARIACVTCCVLAYVICVQSTFSANLAPHFVAIIGANGHFNVGEFVQTLTLTASVILLTTSTLLLTQAPGLASKIGIIVMSLFIGYTTLNNACFMQKQAGEVRNDAPRQKADRIARLDAEIKTNTTAYGQVPKHDYVLETTVQRAQAALEVLKTSAHDECNRSLVKRGVIGDSRGPNC